MLSIHVGFTGTKVGMSDAQKKTLLNWLKACRRFYRDYAEFHHGDCIGADAEAHDIATLVGFETSIHPPINEYARAFCTPSFGSYEAKEYIERNHEIVDCVRVLIATPQTNEEVMRSGTWATVRYARKCKKPVILIMPSGKVMQQTPKTEPLDTLDVTKYAK